VDLSSVGSFLGGIAELLLAVGAGIGWFVRRAMNRKREAERIQAATRTAAAATQRALEDKLEDVYKDRISDLEASNKAKDSRIEALTDQLIKKDGQ
jgi:hypothetical protein